MRECKLRGITAVFGGAVAPVVGHTIPVRKGLYPMTESEYEHKDAFRKTSVLRMLGLINKDGSVDMERAVEIGDGRVGLIRRYKTDYPPFDWGEYLAEL